MEEQTIQAIQLMINGVPNLDAYLTSFVIKNVITLTVAFKVLEKLAEKAGWVQGKEILQLFTGLLPTSIRSRFNGANTNKEEK